jgi:hypothetical protein
MERHPDSASSPGLPADPTAAQTAPRRNWLHRLVNFAVAIVVLAVAAGTFFLSYPGIHAIALQGGVSAQLARIYPGLFDAVLVIACVAAVMLRDARWWARCWAWVVVIVVLAAIGATDVLHAMNYGLEHRPTEGVVAAAPVAAVLLAFSLFLTMLRQSRPQAPEAARGQVRAQEPYDGRAEQPTAPMMFSAADTVSVLAAGSVPRPPAPPIALPAAPVAASADLPDADPDQAPDTATVVTVVTEDPETAQTQEISAFAADASDAGHDPGTAATREEPALTATAPEAPDPTRPPASQHEDVDPPAPPVALAPESTPEAPAEPTAEPTAEVPAEPTAEPTAEALAEAAAEPTAEVPAEPTAEPIAEPTAEVPAEPAPEPTRAPAPAPTPQAIRYASSAAAEPSADDYWEADVDPALAGQVYPVLTSDPDIEVPPRQSGDPQDLEDDAPPFATAPFASVPRLNRVRVTPTPPTDDVDED